MRWLIVEDALYDRKGHWFEYIRTFDVELRALGDDVTVLADRAAEDYLVEQLNVKPVLPASIWHRMSDGAGALRRCLRVPGHAWQTYRAMTSYFRRSEKFDVVFVPTILVHHLLGWACLVKRRRVPCPLLLFFPNLPIELDLSGHPSWSPSPTTQLLKRLLTWLRPEVLSGAVILGVETHAMQEAVTALTQLPAKYFPHPVPSPSQSDVGESTSGDICMACYGPARQEKGSDILIKAVKEYLRRFPESRTHFIFQWIEDFCDKNGDWVRLDGSLLNDKRVEVVRRYFHNGEYARYLAQTDVLLLPYRKSSYGLRVSRVVIEAMSHGLPVVATRGTTLHEQAAEFGAAVLCEDVDVESLVRAIREVEHKFQDFREKAKQQKEKATEHFSVANFRNRMLTPSERTMAGLGSMGERFEQGANGRASL